jgi:hypothetical protein
MPPVNFDFRLSVGEFPEKNEEKDENERQNQWSYHSHRRVRCVCVGGIYRG